MSRSSVVTLSEIHDAALHLKFSVAVAGETLRAENVGTREAKWVIARLLDDISALMEVVEEPDKDRANALMAAWSGACVLCLGDWSDECPACNETEYERQEARHER